MVKRPRTQLRTVSIRSAKTSAAGSIEIAMGNTRVLCTASISTKPPKWLADADPPRGWVSAEYSMLPGSTPDRKRRGPDSRGTEIQRLIGRSLRAGINLEAMPGVAITCDCDVLCADGGTRTASITGAYVALTQALAHARAKGMIDKNPLLGPVAAVSVGLVDGRPTLDLDYPLDSRAEVDLNVVMNGKGQFIEVQGTAEDGPFDRDELDALLDLAAKGIRRLILAQRKFLKR
jgi:ribonuclease PH